MTRFRLLHSKIFVTPDPPGLTNNSLDCILMVAARLSNASLRCRFDQATLAVKVPFRFCKKSAVGAGRHSLGGNLWVSGDNRARLINQRANARSCAGWE
jgi:hypothetical protein